jgi:organic radical activating enzyme
MTSWEDLYSETNEEHVCITGGEPFMHKDNPALNDFIDACVDASKLVHFETSGTIEWHPTLSWICVSPKEGYIPNMLICADEIKLLVDTAFNVDNLPSEVFKHDNVWIQPINDELLINQHNVELCRMLLRVHPKWRLSIQMHKAINWR